MTTLPLDPLDPTSGCLERNSRKGAVPERRRGRIEPPIRGVSVLQEMADLPGKKAEPDVPRGGSGAVTDPDEAVRAAIKAAVDAGRSELAARLLDGRKGGPAGGRGRAEALSERRREEIARGGALSRWGRLPERLRPLFPGYDLEQLRLPDHLDLVVLHVLTRGGEEDRLAGAPVR